MKDTDRDMEYSDLVPQPARRRAFILHNVAAQRLQGWVAASVARRRFATRPERDTPPERSLADDDLTSVRVGGG